MSRLFSWLKAPKNIEIPQGPINVHVQGESWGLKNIKKVPIGEPVRFSLTPKNDYQIKNRWPEGEFYNINTYPSLTTTKRNWLGYITYEGKPTAAKIAELVRPGQLVAVWGFFEIEDGQLNVVITIPRKLEL